MTKVKDGFWKQLGSKVGSNDYLLKAAGGYIGVGNNSGEVVPLNNSTKNEGLNADMVDGLHTTNLVKFYLSPLAGSAPASSAKSWFENTMPSGAGAIVYNVPGSEKTIIVGKSTGAYGHMLQLNYDDKYLRILRYYAGNWKSDDWEKISAGYADSTGYSEYTLSLNSTVLPSSTSNAANTVWCKFATITFNASAWCNAAGYIFFSGGESSDYKGILEYHFRAGQTASELGVAQLSWITKSHDYATVIAVKTANNVYDFYTNNCSSWSTPRIYHFSAYNDRFKWNVGSWSTTKPTAAYTASDIGRVYYSTNAGNANYAIEAGTASSAGTSSNSDTIDGYHYNNLPYVPKLAWHSENSGESVNDLVCGTSFYYTTHGAPTSGVVASFTGTHNSYQLQIQGQYYGKEFWYRSKNGDNGTWNAWTQVIDTNNIGSQHVSYATSAGSVAWGNVTGKPFNWSGQSGQPTWLWGSNDGTNYYVWNPSNFNVNYAKSATSLGSGALKYMCSLYATGTYNAYKITTDWHKSSNIMPTINIRGYAYGSVRTIDCDIVMYHYENSSCNYSLTNKGSYPIRVWQAIENDVQVFYINPGEYFGMFNVFVYGGIGTDAFSNWSMTTVDSVSGTEIGSVPIATSITGNADSVDGYHASSFSLSTHTHTFNLGNTTITTNGDSYSGITGPFNIYTNSSSSNAFTICRYKLAECVEHWVDDDQYHIDYTNDETSSSIHIRIINTDTESGNKTNTTDYHYYLDCYGNFRPGSNNTGSIGISDYKWANMYATTFHGSLDGNATSATQATNLTPENTAHYFRDPNNSTWRGGMIWGSAGSESMSFVVANSDTRFQFVGGSDIANWGSSTWQSANPYLTIYSSGIVTPGSATASGGFIKSGYDNTYVLLAGGGHKAESNLSVSYASSAGDADTSNRTKFLETFQQNSTTNTYGSQYPIWAQWSDSTNVRLKCTNYTVWTDKANYANSAGNADTVDNMHASTLLHLDGYYYIPGNGTNSSTKLWSKIGSITFTGAWQQCGASLTFYEWEARHMMGELKFNIRTSSSESNARADIVWMNLTNKKFENSFIICRTGNGTYDIYFEYPAISYINIKFYIISQYDNGYLTWQNGSALTSIEPTYVNEKFVSSLSSWVGNANYAIEAGTASSAGSVAWANITGKPSTFTPSSHTHPDTFQISNEENYVNLSFRDAALSQKASEKYIECWDGAGGWWNWKANKWIKVGSDDSYVLLGGGGHKLISDFATAEHTHSLGNKSASDLSSTYPQGISVGGIYANGYPFTYGCTITASGNGGYFQIAGQWNSGVTGDSNYDFPTEMYIRGRRDSYDVWTTWTRVLTDRNYTNVLDNRYYTETEADNRFVNVTGDTMTGLLTTAYGSSHNGIKIGNTYINAIDGNLIFQNNSAIRFGGDSWDWNIWAGLKYEHSSKTIYLGLAGNSVFDTNSDQSGGTLNLSGIYNISSTFYNIKVGSIIQHIPATSGWYTIAQVSGYFNYDLYITGGWWNGMPSTVRVNICNINGTTKITQFAGYIGYHCSQIRLGQVNTDVWDVQLYINGQTDTLGDQKCIFTGYGGLIVYNTSAASSTSYSVTNTLAFGQISGISLTSDNYTSYLDGRYYTETEADNRFVNVTGDTMSGRLNIGVESSGNANPLCLYHSNVAATEVKGKSVGIRLGHDANSYYARIAAIFESQNPDYLRPGLAFYTMDSTYQENTESERMRISAAGNVGIGTTSPGYKLTVSGDSYTTGWSRADGGFYVEGTGVHFTHQGSVGEIDMTSNNEFLWGSSSTSLYFNYRAVSRGTTVNNYIWNAGSSDSYASHNMGNIWLNGSGVYLRLGPQNSSHAHYETNASVSHWFNKRVDVAGDIWRYGTNYGIASDGQFYAKAIYANRDASTTGGGVSLYSNADPMNYGIAFRGTGTYGIHGFVTSANDWATYLTMSDNLTRGWIFRRGSTNVASIAGSGNMAIGQHLKFSNEAHISTNRSTDYHYGYTFNLGENTKSIGMYSGPAGEAGGIVISPDGCLIYNSSDCGYNLQVRDKDLGGDLTNIATLTFAIEQGYCAWSRGGFKKNGSDDSYVLLGGGGHKLISDFATAEHTHDGRYLRYEGWWSSGSGQNVDDANGMTFVYGDHGTPNGWGILCTFDYTYNSGYKFQLFAEGYSADGMYYRCRSSDRGGWTSWKTVIDSGNIGSQSVNYADSAGNADTVDGQHFSYSNDSNSPTYLWATNSNGSSFLADRGSISVNYATSAGSVAWGNVTGKPFNWSGQSGQPSWLWGSNDGTNYYVWDPSNFSVNYADSAGSANYLNQQSISSEDTAIPDGTGFAVYKGSTSATGADGHIMSFGWSTGIYGAQIYIDTDPTYNISIRQRNGSGTWQPWKKILTEANYTEIVKKINDIDTKYLFFWAGSIYKNSDESAQPYYSTGPGFNVTVTRTRRGAYQVTVINNNLRYCYIYPMIYPLFKDKGAGSCYEHGFAYLSNADNYEVPLYIVSGGSVTFTIICGYVHTQKSWSESDFTKSNDDGGFICQIFASWQA